MTVEEINHTIRQLENIASVTVRAIKQHLTTAVSSLPKVWTVKGSVDVTNQKNLEKLVIDVSKHLQEVKKAISDQKFPTKLEVTNIKDTPLSAPVNIPPFPTEISIKNQIKEMKMTNIKELADKIFGLQQTFEKEFQKIKWDPKITLPAPIVRVESQKLPTINFPEAETLISEDPKKAVPVRLSDGEEFYKAAEELSIAVRQLYSFVDPAGKKSQARVDGSLHLLTASGDFWGLNNKATSGSTTYLGEENTLGQWKVTKIVKSGSSVAMTYATIKNNTAVTEYADAWTDRATLDYGTFAEIA